MTSPTSQRIRARRRSIIPGFGLTLGYTLLYLALLVLLPLTALIVHASALAPADWWQIISSPRVLASLRLSFGASFLAGIINTVFGLLVAWVLVRYRFFGRRLVDAIIDLPFALPTAVAGISLTAAYAKNGIIGGVLDKAGIAVAFTPLGVLLALTFIGFPFVVRTLQPILEDLQLEFEEAAATLGAGRWRTFYSVTLPALLPGLLTGFTLAFARALGEYGSVVFISGNMPLRTEIVPLLIMTKLEQFDYRGATALATLVLVTSFILLLAVNALQVRLNRQAGQRV